VHIVHTEASCGWGGQELRILNEARGMLDRGHKVTLLTPRIAQIFDAAERIGIPVEPMPFERKSLHNMRVLRHWLRDNAVDVINTHSSIDSWLSAVARIGLRPRPPIVRTRHISAPISRSITSRWLYRSGADRVVTTGESLRLDLIERTGLDGARIVSIPTGTDTERFAPRDPARVAAIRASLGIPADATVIGIAATLRSWKGHDYLLAAFERLGDSHPDLQLLIAGDGPRRSRIEQARDLSPYGGRIHMLGHRDDVPDVLAAMDIFALPSYANEGVPQAILQAMAMQKPVVTTRVGAIEDAVVDQQTGLFVGPKNADDLAEKLERLIDDAGLRDRLGAAGRSRVEANFAFGHMIARMEQVFLEAMRA
jgi:glycosyltransferase involved in cell wall biosynthesis